MLYVVSDKPFTDDSVPVQVCRGGYMQALERAAIRLEHFHLHGVSAKIVTPNSVLGAGKNEDTEVTILIERHPDHEYLFGAWAQCPTCGESRGDKLIADENDLRLVHCATCGSSYRLRYEA